MCRLSNLVTKSYLYMLWFKLFYLWFEFYFPLFQTHYHTLPYPKQWKIKFKPRIELKVYPELIKVHTANIEIRPCVKWFLTRGRKQWKIIKPSTS